ncbi:hypothetical protein GGS23DRAFT_157730 [Durotheca rogersii]|uniref:uncharacterized protein n=1 Tax=Durotheca rogersii TaxID=419775 RepID=UPI00221EF544|nr:uncharacterized protein GGS23DRAFT_157730 [Durotheca rogersii]KAI5861197.1 hypothetical protein GGS23DRAFT_157730 [Durotheca rogersii]
MANCDFLLVRARSYESFKKTELELALDEYLAENASTFSADPKLANYYSTRARTTGSPLKKDVDAPPEKLKVSRRRTIKAPEDLAPPESEDEPASASSAVARTPGRALSLASRIPLPATPADVAEAVDRSTVAVRAHVASLYRESGISEATRATRATLSTVGSVVAAVSLFELYFLRPEVLPDRYAFTVPAVAFLGTPDYPVFVPDLFLLLSASFWSPALLWAFTSAVLPAAAGYFVNLGSGAREGGRAPPSRTTRAATSAASAAAAAAADAAVDPLAFSIAKALISYVVYGQGATFGGWISAAAIARVDSAVYGGYRGVLVGAAVTGVLSIYDAVLKK